MILDYTFIVFKLIFLYSGIFLWYLYHTYKPRGLFMLIYIDVLNNNNIFQCQNE